MTYSEMYEAYRRQKSAAKRRGLVFCFDYEDWVNWWEEQLGTHWFDKRGCKRGQYVMARNNDCGAYIRGNVSALKAEENIGSYNRRRKTVSIEGCCHLSNEVVQAIYLDPRGYATIAKKHNITKHRIQCIKRKVYYRKITDVLD